jgi:hypothetical protein
VRLGHISTHLGNVLGMSNAQRVFLADGFDLMINDI